MALNPAERLGIEDQAVRGDWDQDKLDSVLATHEKLTEAGHDQITQVEGAQQRALGELATGRGISATTEFAIDDAAARGDWPEERRQKALENAAKNSQ